jgi:hypothetical protein
LKKTALLLVVFLCGVSTGAILRQTARAQTYISDSPAAPAVSLTQGALLKFWSNQAAARGVTNDAQWNTAMNTLFATGTSPGMDPTALAFLRSFFIQIVHVGVP